MPNEKKSCTNCIHETVCYLIRKIDDLVRNKGFHLFNRKGYNLALPFINKIAKHCSKYKKIET